MVWTSAVVRPPLNRLSMSFSSLTSIIEWIAALKSAEQCSALLSAAIRSMIEVKEEKDIDSLFSGGRTTALVHTIAGLDDFELIAFLVIEEGAT